MVKIWPVSARNQHVIRDRYQHLRQVQCEVHSKLFNFLPKGQEPLKVCARRLAIPFEEKTLIFGAESEMTVLFDYALYDYREPIYPRDARNAIERMLIISPPDEGSDAMIMLRAAEKARYRLLVVEGVEEGVGVKVQDIFRKESFFLFDVGFSRTAILKQGLAARVVEPEGIPMTTGAALPVDQRVLCDVAEDLDREFTGHVRGGVDSLSPQERAKLSAIVIRNCLAHETSSHIAYE